jgi:phage-related protein
VNRKQKNLIWVGNSKKNLIAFPEEVQSDIGFALHLAQEGEKHSSAKPLTGIGSGVMEIVSDYDTNTYRAVYAVNINDTIYVLHTFQKKSKSGIATPKPDIELIKQRLKAALEHAKGKKQHG